MKEKLRKKYSELREGIPPSIRRVAGEAAAAKLMNHPLVKNSRGVMVYISAGNEVPTDILIRRLLSSGHRVYIPVMEDGLIRPVRLTDPAELKPGAFGIGEVPPEERVYADLEEADIIITPGLCFSADGSRLGRGGGHYDRFLEKSPAYKIGLCYSFQLAGDIPQRGHDVRVDEVVAVIDGPSGSGEEDICLTRSYMPQPGS